MFDKERNKADWCALLSVIDEDRGNMVTSSAAADDRGSRPEQPKASLSRRYLVLGLAATALYLFLPASGVTRGLVTVAVHATSVALVPIAIRMNRPDRSWPWYTLAAGNAMYFVGDIIFFLVPEMFNVTLPFPGPSDFFYLSGYVLLLVGLWGLVGTPGSGPNWPGIIDSTIVTVGLGSASWVFTIAPSFQLSGFSYFGRLVAASYPFIDVLFIAVLVRLVLSPGRHLPVYSLLGAGVISVLVADSYYAVSSLSGTFSYTSPFLIGYLLFYVFLAAATLHPSMPEATRPKAKADPLLTQQRLIFLALSALIPPVLIILEALQDANPSSETGNIIFMACISAFLFLLVLVRMRGLMIDIAEHERIKKLKDDFTSVVSHELRTPLTSMRGALGLMASGVLGPIPDKAKRMVDIAVVNSERLIRLINDILDIDKMESGNLTLDKRTVDAGELMRYASQEMKGMAEQAEVRVSTSPQMLDVWADRDRIIQVLTNLLSNAIQFSPRGGTVELAVESRNGQVQFAVADEGSGIPQDKLEMVFERFKQVDSSDSRAKGGTGLGLAICRKIVAQHGGRIWVESQKEKGSTFFFTLPRSEAQPVVPVASPSPDTARTPRVLVCDDDPSILDVVRAILEQRGYDVTTVGSGEQAVDSAINEVPDAVILDLLMPGMNGWDVAAQLKQLPETRQVPIIILSVVSSEDIERPLPGVVDWVPKPVDDLSLTTALEKAMSHTKEISRVLMVEDDLDLARVLIAMLEHRGLEVWHAATGQQAVELAGRITPDLVILDLTLPDGDGTEMVDCLQHKGSSPAVPIVVYTAADPDARLRHRLQGVNAVEILTKGRVTPEDFEARVLKLVDRMAPGVKDLTRSTA